MNCQKGDLAEIIHATHPENIGRIVEVVAYLCDSQPYGPMWRVRSNSIRFRCSTVDADSGELLANDEDLMEFHCPDSWLRPIKPGKQAQREEATGATSTNV